MKLDSWKEEFAGKKILIWGYGKEGRASYALIRKVCPDLIIDIAESREKGVGLLDKARSECTGVRTLFDDEADFKSYDMILKSPGIVVADSISKANITGETQLFLKHYRSRTIGVTGSKGKSTTTSVIAAALSQKYKVHLVGNIGRACFDCIEEMEEGDLIAYEMSCHQLEYSNYSPHVAVLLNLYEEHLDHYGTMEKYAHAKENIFRHQTKGDIAILGKDLKDQIAMRPDALRIGMEFGADGKVLFIGDHHLDCSNCRLVGDHNYVNASVAYYIAHELYGVSDEKFLQAMASFQPLEHRIEDLGEFEGIRYVNDSISTIGQACILALKALDDVDTVLVGGMDRGIRYDELEAYLAHQKDLHVIFMYGAGARIYREMKEKGLLRDTMYYCDTLAEAVEMGRKLTRPHHICLLSPAASSYDHFKNFEERGHVFRKLAFKL